MTSLLLPSVAALIVGGTSFVPEAQAETSQAEYYKSLMESIKKGNEAPPAVLSAPAIQGPLVAASGAAQGAAPAAADTGFDFGSLFSWGESDTKPKKEGAAQVADEEQPKAPSAAEIRAKRAEEVGKKQREAEKAAQEAKAQAEGRVKEAKERAEKELEQKRKEAADRLKPKQAPPVAAATANKTHGYLPLFITQFLFLALYAGGITLAFFLPDSQAKQLQSQANALFEKARPLLEQAKPLADQAVTQGNSLFRQAQPYVSKAAKQAVPLAKQAVDASKPLVSQAQEQIGTTIKKFREEQKV